MTEREIEIPAEKRKILASMPREKLEEMAYWGMQAAGVIGEGYLDSDKELHQARARAGTNFLFGLLVGVLIGFVLAALALFKFGCS